MCLHSCRLLSDFSNSQSWAQQTEIKNKTKRNSDESRVKAGFWEEQQRPGGLAALLWWACRLGGGMLSPRARGPSVPTRIPPIRNGVSGSSTVPPAGGQRRWSPPHLSPHRCISQADVHLTISATGHSQTPHRPLAATKLLDRRGCRAWALPGK